MTLFVYSIILWEILLQSRYIKIYEIWKILTARLLYSLNSAISAQHLLLYHISFCLSSYISFIFAIDFRQNRGIMVL